MSRIVIDENLCKGCELCTIACPYELIRISERFNAKGYRPAAFADPDQACIGCANCAMMCPDVAIVVFRTRKAQSSPGPQRVSVSRRIGQPRRAR